MFKIEKNEICTIEHLCSECINTPCKNNPIYQIKYYIHNRKIGKPLKILICGDRNWSNTDIIKSILEAIPKYALIIEGECRGADQIAGQIAENTGFSVKKYPADWNLYGKSAGILRNIDMLKENPTVVIAFHDNIEKSKGTGFTINEARRQLIPTIIITTKTNITEK